MSAKTLGIACEIESPQTGAVATFHKITAYYYDLLSRNVQVTVYGYVSQKACADGKQPINNTATQVTLAPDDVVSEESLYQKIVAKQVIDAQHPGVPNIFAGATLVTE